MIFEAERPPILYRMNDLQVTSIYQKTPLAFIVQEVFSCCFVSGAYFSLTVETHPST